jgi:DNA-binding NarL/FixJ family response regulator
MLPLHHVRVRVTHADPLIAAGLLAVLAQRPEIRVVDEGAEADVILADYHSGVTLAQRGQRRTARVLIVTHVDKEWQVGSAFSHGVSGYLMQTCAPDELFLAIQHVTQGLQYQSLQVRAFVNNGRMVEHLTARENDVLQLLATGRCNKEIARALGIGVGTVKTHLKGVMNKLGASARTHAVVLAARRGLVEQGPAMH